MATGAGTADKRLWVWNISTNEILVEKECQTQVCNVLIDDANGQIISGHGYPENNINIWSIDKLKKVNKLKGHSQWVLFMCLSPCGRFLASATGDETLRIWSIETET